MNHDVYRELLSLAHALTYLSESELLSSILKKAGYNLSSFELNTIINVVADNIYLNLTEK